MGDRRPKESVVGRWCAGFENRDDPAPIPAHVGLFTTSGGEVRVIVNLQHYNKPDLERLGHIALSPEQANMLATSILAKVPWEPGDQGDYQPDTGQHVIQLRMVPEPMAADHE